MDLIVSNKHDLHNEYVCEYESDSVYNIIYTTMCSKFKEKGGVHVYKIDKG